MSIKEATEGIDFSVNMKNLYREEAFTDMKGASFYHGKRFFIRSQVRGVIPGHAPWQRDPSPGLSASCIPP